MAAGGAGRVLRAGCCAGGFSRITHYAFPPFAIEKNAVRRIMLTPCERAIPNSETDA